MATAAAAPLSAPVASTKTGRVYARIAAACVAVAFVGFAPSYWVPLIRGTLAVRPIAHLHAFIFYTWVMLFWYQAVLAASGRMTRHREFGVAGVALASAMTFIGLAMAVDSLRAGEAVGVGASVRAFTIVPVSGIALFAVLICIALLNVRKPETHKRVMLVATASLLQAAVGRWFVLFLAPPGAVGAPPVAVSVLPGLLSNLLFVAGMVHDKRTRGRVHPAYWAAGGAVLAVQLLRVPLSVTDGWIRVTDGLLALFP